MKLHLTRFVLAAAITTSAALANDLTTNGNFELGDTSGWDSFPSATSTFDVTMDASSGSFAGVIMNDSIAAAALVKQANIGVGTVKPGDQILISFAAKGSGAVGGVAFAEFFSEIAGGGVSSAEILTGAPLQLTNEWQNFCFTTTAGANVSGGVTLQLNAVTGGAPGSMSTLFFDDVKVSVEELSVNGDFELGDTSGWQSFPTATSVFQAIPAAANSGALGGLLANVDSASAALIKQANVGAGLLKPGDTIEVSFAARGAGLVGGVAFAEFFSEIAGGGVSQGGILGGAPLPLTLSWQNFSYTLTAGPDVSGGVTLQFAAVTGAASGSESLLQIDDVSIRTTAGSTQNYCAATPNSTGVAATMSSSGSPSVSAQDFVIEANNLPSETFCLFFVADGTDNLPSFNGNRCIGANAVRIGPILQSSTTGSVSRDMPDSVYTQFGATPPMVGSCLNFQCVYRDAVGAGGNWTDGLFVVFGN